MKIGPILRWKDNEIFFKILYQLAKSYLDLKIGLIFIIYDTFLP